jgi:hypothetical protein
MTMARSGLWFLGSFGVLATRYHGATASLDNHVSAAILPFFLNTFGCSDSQTVVSKVPPMLLFRWSS